MKNHSKYYKILLGIYLSIVVAYTLVLVGVFTHYSYEQFSTMDKKDKKIMAEQIRESIDSRLVLQDSTERQLVYSECFGNVIINNSYLDKIILSREIARIGGYMLNQGSNITVLYGSGSTSAISAWNIGSKSDFYSEMTFSDEDILRIDEYILNGTAEEMMVAASQYGGENMLTVFKKVRMYPSYNVVLCYSYSFDYILGNVVHPGGSEISICRGGEVLISNNRFGDYDRTPLAEYLQQLPDGNSVVDAQMKLNGERCTIYASASEINDWCYVFAVPDKERVSMLWRIAGIAAVIFILALGAGFVIIRWLTEMVYNPVRKLVNSADIDAEHAKDEFAALKSALDSGKSKYDELQAYIRENKQGKESFLKDLLNGNLPAREIREGIGKFSLEWLSGECFIIVFAITNMETLQREFGDIDFYNVRNELVELLEEKISKTMTCEIVRMSADRFAAVVKGQKAENLEKYLIEQVSRIEYTTAVEIRVFISDGIQQPENFGRAYYRISEKVNSSLRNSRVIVKYGDSMQDKKMWYYPIELEKNLIENTLSGARESVKLLLERVYEENFDGKTIDERDYTQLIFAICATVNRILTVLKTDSETVFGADNKLYNELALCSDVGQIKDKINSVFLQLCNFIEKQNDEHGQDLASEMLRFVDENYQKEISLYDLAEVFNYSINYISRVFARETGKNFKEYLSLKRVAKAKDFLRSGNYTIAQVAQMVGCANSNSFIRLFKRCEGITPGQYLESIEKT